MLLICCWHTSPMQCKRSALLYTKHRRGTKSCTMNLWLMSRFCLCCEFRVRYLLTNRWYKCQLDSHIAVDLSIQIQIHVFFLWYLLLPCILQARLYDIHIHPKFTVKSLRQLACHVKCGMGPYSGKFTLNRWNLYSLVTIDCKCSNLFRAS